MRATRAGIAAAAGAAVLALAGCADDAADREPTETVTSTVTQTPDPGGDGTPEPGPTETAPPADDDPPRDAEEFHAATEPDEGEPSDDAVLSPTGLRFAEHEGYDRVVLDLEGTGEPGWWVAYVESPAEQGSGAEVDLDGQAFLEVAVTGVQYPTEEGAEEYGGPDEISPTGSEVIEEVVVGGIFEGRQQMFLGLVSEQPVRVFGLADPPRLVIDVQHP